MFQNARQLVTLLKDAFPHPGFDGTLREVNCIGPRSEGEKLACLWLGCLESMASEATPKSEKLVRLLDVRTSRPELPSASH